MSEIEKVMQANRAAVEELAVASDQCAASWTTPRAPGKWSPSQVVEHVARALEESAKAVTGEPTRFPSLPFFLRPLVRTLFLKRVIRSGRFGKARTNRAMDPIDGPPTPAEGRMRLEGAVRAYHEACLTRAKSGDTFDSTIFGTVSLVDYGRFQVLHTRHHRRQLPA
jgi:hypothetical protein